MGRATFILEQYDSTASLPSESMKLEVASSPRGVHKYRLIFMDKKQVFSEKCLLSYKAE